MRLFCCLLVHIKTNTNTTTQQHLFSQTNHSYLYFTYTKMSTTDTSLQLNRLNTGPFFSTSLAKLKSVALEQLARTLFLSHNFGPEAQERWLGQQTARIKKLDQSVRRPDGMIGAMKANMTRHEMFHAHANLCEDHMDLKSKLVRSLTLLVAEECTLRADVFRYYRKKGKLDDRQTNAWLTIIDKVLVLWCGEVKARKMLKYQPNYVVPAMASAASCEACKLAILGGCPEFLSALRAGVIARTAYFADGGQGYAHQPQILEVINAWLSTSYPPAMRVPLLRQSDALAPAITAFRMRKRVKRERTRALRELRRNERHVTRANRAPRRPRTPEPSFDKGDAEAVHPGAHRHRHLGERLPPPVMAEDDQDVDEEEAIDNGHVSMMPAEERDDEPWMAEYRDFIQGTGGPPMPGAFGPVPDSPTLSDKARHSVQNEDRPRTPRPYEENLTRQGPRLSRGRYPPQSYREPSVLSQAGPPVPPKEPHQRRPSVRQSRGGPPVPPKEPKQRRQSKMDSQGRPLVPPKELNQRRHLQKEPPVPAKVSGSPRGWSLYGDDFPEAIQHKFSSASVRNSHRPEGSSSASNSQQQPEARDSHGVSDCSAGSPQSVHGDVRRGRVPKPDQAPSVVSMQTSINEIASMYEATGWGGPKKPDRHVWDDDRR